MAYVKYCRSQYKNVPPVPAASRRDVRPVRDVDRSYFLVRAERSIVFGFPLLFVRPAASVWLERRHGSVIVKYHLNKMRRADMKTQ